MSKTILSEIDGFTPLPDLLVKRYGVLTAAVWGRMWRFCQMESRVCQASLETIGGELNLDRSTIMRHIETLVVDGWMEDRTPGLRNKPHTYADTGKMMMYNRFGMSVAENNTTLPTVAENNSTVAQNNTTVAENHLKIDSKRESKIENSIEGEADKKTTVPEGFPIEWLIAHGNPVDQAQIDKLINAKAACDKFEQVFAFHSLPWSVNGTWEKFERWVVKIYTDYPTLFQEYVDWRRDQGKYKAMSNKQIRTNPLMFIDTGYPEFEASKMYADKPTKKGSGKQTLQDVQDDLREWLEEKGETANG